ncbi:MAG TPA: hypothetical protein VKA60_27220 [Blastocatellia bacterium]|nr:hypothetical protein [Blastocatellia bacterium]
MNGIVQSGGTAITVPLANVPVTVYEATSGDPLAVGSGQTDATGNFSLGIARAATSSIFYAVASLGNQVELVTIIGRAIPPSITINELTTVAAAYAMAQFTANGVIAGDAFALRIAAGMNDNLVVPETGASSEVLLAPPNADQTNSLRSTRSLANLLAACVENYPEAISTLLALATPPVGLPPANTFQALVNIARYPWNNVPEIYQQTLLVDLYSPSLDSIPAVDNNPPQRIPTAWTIAVKVNDSGGDYIPFGGPANVAFDQNGYAWVANNVFQGTPNSTRGIIVLKPNGKPADGKNGTPMSPITGGGILGPGFGICIDTRGMIWVGNFGWGNAPGDIPDGSVTQLSPLGQPISGPQGFKGGTHQVQAVASDQENNIWCASYLNNRVVVFPNGDPTRAFWFQEEENRGTFGVAIAEDGSAWITNSGGLSGRNGQASVCKYVIENIVEDGTDTRKLKQVFRHNIGNALKGVSVDSLGNAWVASGGDDSVYFFSPDGEQVVPISGGEDHIGGIDSPWGVAVDGDDNIWVANFGPIKINTVYTTAAVSYLAGANPNTRPAGLNTGDPIAPNGYTLPTAGEQVLLHSGIPLYGPNGDPCYNPLMRMTNVVIDQAGNLWAINNWKPNFNTDFEPAKGNPGGDGIVIFVGVARPPKQKS